MAPTFLPRPAEQSALGLAFDAGANPLVVWGPPGCGKSALVRAWCVAERESCAWADLAQVGDPEAVVAQVAAAVGAGPSDASQLERVLAAFRGVLVLDDADRASGLAEAIERWQEVAPHLRLIVTSRERLPIPGADHVQVGPMTEQEAFTLFVHRAQAVRPTFEPDSVRPIVVELVAALDHVPLAIELAAARTGTLGPAEILGRLSQRFRLLRGSGSSLHAAIEASWEQLGDVERSVLAQCAVFRCGFDLATAEAVLRADGEWVVDVIDGLVAKSLLRTAIPPGFPGEVRFDMLSSIRDFVAPFCDADVVARHANWFAEQGRQWSWEMRTRGGEHARMRLELEQDNLLAAFERAEADLAIDLALILDKSFRLRGGAEVWERVLDRALAAAAQADLGRRALLHRARGELYLLRGGLDRAAAELLHAAEAAEAAGEPATLGWTEFLAAEAERRRGRPREALDRLARAENLAHAHGLPNLERTVLAHRAGCLVDLHELDAARVALAKMENVAPGKDLRDEAALLKRVAYAQFYLGNADEQSRLTEAALALARECGDRRLEAICLQGLGDAAFVQGRYDEARSRYAEALGQHRALGSLDHVGALLGNLGTVLHRLDLLDDARRCYREALDVHRTTGARPYEAVVWFALGVLEMERRHPEDAHAALEQSASLSADVGADDDVGAARLLQSWITPSPALNEAARAAFERSGDADWVALCDLCAGRPDAAIPTTGVARLVADLLTGASVDPAAASRSLHARAARAWLGDRDAARRPAAPAAPVYPSGDHLVVARDGLWFEVAGESVDLRRRKAPRRILAHLVDGLERRPGEATDVYEMFEVGWPGEVATVEAAADRVYWAIRTLRRLGLERWLVTSDAGYLLDARGDIEVR